MLFQKRLYAFVRPSITQYSGINRVTFHILPFCVCDSWKKNTNLPTMRQSSMVAVKTIEKSYTAGYLYILYIRERAIGILTKLTATKLSKILKFIFLL